jgi:hypothetical protein
MAGHQCYHCKQWIEEGEAHDCWTTSEGALTRHLSEDLRDAWERLRETAVSFGEQRIYASHKSIMFSRKSCYFFVRPKRDFLEVCVFLGRTLKARQVRRVDRASKSKTVHVLHIRHRDEVETPITDWLQEAYALPDTQPAKTRATAASAPRSKPAPRPDATVRAKSEPPPASAPEPKRKAAPQLAKKASPKAKVKVTSKTAATTIARKRTVASPSKAGRATKRKNASSKKPKKSKEKKPEKRSRR